MATKPVTQYETLECKVFPGTHNLVKKTTNKPMEPTIKAYSWQNIKLWKLIGLTRWWLGWLVYTGLRQTVRNSFQDKNSHIWTVTNAFQVRIWNGGCSCWCWVGFFLKSQTHLRLRKFKCLVFFVLFASQLPSCEYFVHQYKKFVDFFFFLNKNETW